MFYRLSNQSASMALPLHISIQAHAAERFRLPGQKTHAYRRGHEQAHGKYHTFERGPAFWPCGHKYSQKICNFATPY